MNEKLFALYVPWDTHQDVVDQKIRSAFGEASSSFSPDGQVYHFNDLVRSGDTVRHTVTNVAITVSRLREFFQEVCAFPRESTFEQDQVSGALQRISGQ